MEWALLALQVVLAAIAVPFAIIRRRSPVSTVAWIFAILAFPILGSVAYFALANPYVRRPRLRKRAANLAVRGADPLVGLSDEDRGLFRASALITGIAPTAGNRVTLLLEGREAFSSIEATIAEARRSVWAEYYIVHEDPTGRRFLDALAERAEAGLDVRLMVDAVGTPSLGDAAVRLLRAGAQVRFFLPVNPLRRRWAVHLRNHRKLLVADGICGFVGGMNIGDLYAGVRSGGQRPWRDAHLRLEGPAARDLAQAFAEDWHFQTGELLGLPPASPPCGEAEVAIMASGPDQRENATAILWFACIGLAVRRAWLTTPYFAPDEPTVRALCSAALRGCDVRVLVPDRIDVRWLRLVNRSFFPRLVAAGVRCFEYQPAMIHAKTLLVDDDIAIVGSANVDARSFLLNFEAGALVADFALVTDLAARYRLDLQDSREATSRSLAMRPTWERLAEGTAQLLSPLL